MVRKAGYPQSRQGGNQEVRVRFLPDSLEQITQSVNSTGYRGKLESVVKEAIKRANK